jgi:hypothetical protein
MPWATIQQVTDQTGKTVDTADLALASSIIDTYAGTDPEMPEASLTARDRATLRKATAWQAVWIAGQPGYLEHRGVDYSPTADGTSAQRKSQADQDLAPLAQRELKNLSWIGTQVVNLRSQRSVPKGALMIDFLNESSDGGYGSGGYSGGGSSSGGLTGWQEITGKPLVFPPDLHSHTIAEVDGLQDALDLAGVGEGGTVSLAWSEITGRPSTFPPSTHVHVIGWADIANKPANFPPEAHGHGWAEISGKPSNFPPTAHTHTQGEVTGLSAALGSLAPLTALTGVEDALEAADAALDGRVTALEDAPAGGGSALVVRRGKVTSGNLTFPVAGAWVAVPGSPELVVPAAVGDYVEFSLPSMLGNFSVNFGDLAVRVGGALVRYLSTGTNTPATEGAPAFYGDQGFDRTSPVFEFVVEAGDLEGGNVTVVFATQGSGGGTVYASTDYPLKWRALNYGPVS